MFGWVSQEKAQTKQEQHKILEREVAYRGRIRFSNAMLTHAIKDDTPLTLSILGSPHPTSLEFYLGDIEHIKARRDGQHGYNEPNAKIRGRKIYRHHKQWDHAEPTSSDRSDQNRTIQGVYKLGSQWKFTIEFENMQPVELGALLWTLELAESGKQGYHRMGYGKPLGFGSVQIEITGLDFYDAKTRYKAADRVEPTDEGKHKQQREHLVSRFKTAISCLYDKTPFAQLSNIEDLLVLLSEPNADLAIHYPRLDVNRQAADNEGFRWFMANRDGQQNRLEPTMTDSGLPYNVKK
jgi:CRISPR-associated protein (TIGR03986 family)